MQRRLTKDGLLPPRVRRTPVARRTENAAPPTEFFQQASYAAERRRFTEDYEPTPPELLEQWRRQSLLAQRRFDTFERFGPAVIRYSERHADTVRAEVMVDFRATELKGDEPAAAPDPIAPRAPTDKSAPSGPQRNATNQQNRAAISLPRF
jgi:hypothetical protein